MSEIKLAIASPPERERVVAEGWLEDELIFELSNEPDRHFLVELYSRRDGQPWRLPIDDLVQALSKARQELDYPAARSDW